MNDIDFVERFDEDDDDIVLVMAETDRFGLDSVVLLVKSTVGGVAVSVCEMAGNTKLGFKSATLSIMMIIVFSRGVVNY